MTVFNIRIFLKNWVQCTSAWLHTLILNFAGICIVLVLFNASCKIAIFFFDFLWKFSIFSQKENSVCQWHLSHKLTVCKLTALTINMFWLCGFIISPTSPICFVWSTLIWKSSLLWLTHSAQSVVVLTGLSALPFQWANETSLPISLI